MPKLKTAPRIERPDEFYRALAQLHDGLSVEESLLVNWRLILLLANHVGDHDVLMEALDKARLAPRA